MFERLVEQLVAAYAAGLRSVRLLHEPYLSHWSPPGRLERIGIGVEQESLYLTLAPGEPRQSWADEVLPLSEIVEREADLERPFETSGSINPEADLPARAFLLECALPFAAIRLETEVAPALGVALGGNFEVRVFYDVDDPVRRPSLPFYAGELDHDELKESLAGALVQPAHQRFVEDALDRREGDAGAHARQLLGQAAVVPPT